LLCDSVYATSKRDQEELCLAVGRAYGFRAVALRFFNVYGPRQSLTNPYTGVAAIFSSQILSGRRPTVFEDGLQSRDFVHVSDIVDAIIRALSSEAANGMAINVGTGQPSTILEIAETLAMALGTDIKPDVVGRFRQGDIRHCYADISLAEQTLGYRPQTRLADGMAQLVEWIRDESPAVSDLTGRSQSELEARGLIV
jgi:dTDP-L-rhamnose 4-epimerase